MAFQSSVTNQKNRPRTLVLVLLAGICILEGFIFRGENWLLKFPLMETTLHDVSGWYVEGFQYQNNLEDTPIHAEAYGLAQNAYTLAGRYQVGKDNAKLDVNYYPADHFRILFPYLASFFLAFFNLEQAYLTITILFWCLTCIAIYYVGLRIFHSHTAGFLAALLCATSHQYPMLVTDPKGALFQFSAIIILIALALYLDHFSDDTSHRALKNSFLLGLIAGILAYGSIGSAFFLPFISIYGVISMKFTSFLKKTLVFAGGCLVILLVFNNFTFQVFSSTSYALLFNNLLSDLSFTEWWQAYRFRMFHQVIFQIPLHVWIGAVIGLCLLKNRRQLIFILCMFSSLFFTEVYMLSLSSPYYRFGPSFYYIEFLFALYLLNANMLTRLWEGLRKRPVFQFILRTGVVCFILLNILVANLPLLGNYYYYYQSARATNPDLLYHSNFTYTNLDVYHELNQKEPHEQP